ncbi:MAG: T9SS type A sorting domain-containing protein [Bacteroidota bacterium]
MLQRILLLVGLVGTTPSPASAQAGCTDPLAENYEPTATQNDGSCTYPLTNYQAARRANLPADLEECSGLLWLDGQLWGHNDSGNPAILYQLDTLDASIRRRVVLANANNVDWEDLSANQDFVFIGDFGNNDGSRRDLRIYRFPRTDLALDTIRELDTIAFSYGDQSDFEPANLNTPYDCEAFFATADSLHLFSKDWVRQITRHYVLPNQTGVHVAQLRDSLDVRTLVTAADRAPDGTIALLGYEGLEGVLWLLFDYPAGQPFAGHKRRIELGSLLELGQAEALVFREAGVGFLASERLFGFPIGPQLFSFRSAQWTRAALSPLSSPAPELFDPQVYPNPVGGNHFRLRQIRPERALDLALYDQWGRRLWRAEQRSAEVSLAGIEWRPGQYWLRVRQGRLEKWISVGRF